MTATALNRLFDLPRPYKRSLQVLADTGLLTISFAFAMLLRTESLAFALDLKVWAALIAALPVTIILFIKLGFYRAVIRYMGGRALLTILEGVGASALTVAVMSMWLDLPIPASVPFIYAVLAFCTVGGVRFALRGLYLRTQSRLKTRVIIYGAGQSGRQLLHSLAQGPDYAPVAFIDDARDLHGTQISGLKVFAPDQIETLISDYSAKVILLAIPSTSLATRAAILARLENLPIRVQTIPGMADLVTGRARISEIREVTVEDLLGRDPVPASQPLMSANIAGKTVLVSGAGGSIGSELCRQILRQRPVALVLLEQSEYALYEIEAELRKLVAEHGIDTAVIPVLGSVREADRVEAVLREYAVHTIYHAAAYKHVPLVEQNIIEGLRNNVFGTVTIARAAVAVGVDSFILVSTDKAVRPTNVMGASKRLAELVCQALAQGPGRTKFAMVRFGNVLGSSGSVIPLFRRQIASGGPLTVTHPDITRYFMTITEAAQLVIQAGAMARGGDVFLLDMGKPVKILDLARRMIRLSGFNPVVETEPAPRAVRGADSVSIVFTKLRPGEKLFEELLIDECAEPTLHPRILTANEISLPWASLGPMLDRLSEAVHDNDLRRVRQLLLSCPLGYQPPETAAEPERPEVAARRLIVVGSSSSAAALASGGVLVAGTGT